MAVMADTKTTQDEMQTLTQVTAETPLGALPPEPPAKIWTRRLIIFAFWGVVVFLGLPHWIWTTSIHRSELPVDVMATWSEGQASDLRYPINVALGSFHTGIDSDVIAKSVQRVFDSGPPELYSVHVMPQHGPSEADQETALTVIIYKAGDAEESSAQLRTWVPVMDVYPGSTDTAINELGSFIGGEIWRAFADDQAQIAYLIKNTPYAQPSKQAPWNYSIYEKRTTRAFKYASSYHLTFSLFTSAASPSAWAIEEAISQYLQPLLKPLSAISDFTIDTQVQLYAALAPSIAGPQYDEAAGNWRLLQSNLSGFVNAAEWPLSPSIGSGPTINLVLYVPSSTQSPLVIAETGGNSWIIPQWGGVQILNPTGEQSEALTLQDLEPVMLTFADQLTSLLGLPPSPSSLSPLPPPPSSLSLRISSLTRQRATSLILSASSTLGALVRLTRKLESIAIPDTVAKSVDETILRLENACQALGEGRFQAALEHARIAEAEAEKAFFEPSMVGQVYFPEEHKVAVYVPLLGPMAVPLLMSAVKELRSLRKQKVKAS